MKKAISSTTLLLAVLALTCGSALAQPGSGGPAPGALTSAPIDGGASLLLAGGLGLALKQLRERRQKQRKG